MAIMKIAEELLFTTLRIVTTNGQSKGVGTGFIFDYKLKNKNFPFLVTNRHVVEGMEDGTITFTKRKNNKPDIGNGFDVILDNFRNFWYFHPDDEVDVAVTPFMPMVTQCREQGGDPFYLSIPNTIIPNEDELNQLDAIEDIIFIGYPKGLRDEKNLIPLIRKGITATPFNFDYEGKKQFLIDASVFPGSSGSPVFLYNAGAIRKGNDIEFVKRLSFLGIVSAGWLEKKENPIKMFSFRKKKNLVSSYEQMIDIGIVFKAETINETIELLLEKRENILGFDKM